MGRGGSLYQIDAVRLLLGKRWKGYSGDMLKLIIYVPDSHVEVVKAAVFAAGAGKIGDYDCCSWQILGKGQFRALEGSDPYLGEQGKIEQVEEWRVETVVPDAVLQDVLHAMRQAHPYEEPAFDLFRMELPD